MRLARLDLIRYGKFTGRTLDFGSKPNGPDLHIVYGPNEAGKSTAFSAYLDLLFGIGGQSPYAFLHDYAALRIGARLDLAGGARDLVRIKRQKATLLDAQDRPIDDGIIAADLGGIGRDSYCNMFSLDDDSLEEGGEEILASRGDLGQLLFSGSAGASGISRTLDALRAEAAGLFRSNSGKTTLGELRKTLDGYKEARTGIDVQVSRYRQLVEARHAAEAAYGAANAVRAEARRRRVEIGRSLGALPRWAELRDLRAELAPLEDLPEPPAGWSATCAETERREIACVTQLKGLDRDIADAEAALDALPDDPLAAGLAEAVDALAEPRARHRTAERDLPERRLAVRATSLHIEAILRRLGRAGVDPQGLVLGVDVVGRLRALMEARSGLAARLETARDECDAAQRALDEGEGRLCADADTDVPSAEAAGRIALVLAALRPGESTAKRLLAERAAHRLADALADRLRELRPWTGDAAALAALDVPDLGAFEALCAARTEAHTRLEREEAADDGLVARRDGLRAQVEALGVIAGVVGDRDAAAARAARDRAWAQHRATLDAGSADAFADAMWHDDSVTGARYGRAADVARLQQLHLSLAEIETDMPRARARLDLARRAFAEAAEDAETALRPIAPPLAPTLTPSALGDWLARRDRALAARTALLQAERDRDEAVADAGAARDRIAAVLAAAGVTHDRSADIEALLLLARSAVDAEAERRALRRAVEEGRRSLASRQATLAKAEGAERSWAEAWDATCRSCWLGEDGRSPAPDSLGETLTALDELAGPLQSRASLLDRIDKMEADQGAFAERVAALAASLDLADVPATVAARDDAIVARIAAARRNRDDRDKGQRRLAELRLQRAGVSEAATDNLRAKAEMTAFFGVDTLAEVAAGMRLIERRAELRDRIRAGEREIRDALRAPDAASAEAALAGLDRAALDREEADLEASLPDLDARAQDLFAQQARAADALAAVNGGEAVARIEVDRRTALLAFEEGATRYLKLAGGIAAAERALKAYRDRHRSAMLDRASAAFRMVSRGAYRGLATQPGEKGGDVLLVVAADGKSKEAAALSKGTRFQLYLALRAAGYHEFATTRRSVPFVADDIMETFDDFRAEEAFRLFADMASVGQVIYLTHHRHLIPIAQSVCPSLTVHELTAA